MYILNAVQPGFLGGHPKGKDGVNIGCGEVIIKKNVAIYKGWCRIKKRRV